MIFFLTKINKDKQSKRERQIMTWEGRKTLHFGESPCWILRKFPFTVFPVSICERSRKRISDHIPTVLHSKFEIDMKSWTLSPAASTKRTLHKHFYMYLFSQERQMRMLYKRPGTSHKHKFWTNLHAYYMHLLIYYIFPPKKCPPTTRLLIKMWGLYR